MLRPNTLKIIDSKTINAIHEKTAEVLEKSGVNFENEEALKIMKEIV